MDSLAASPSVSVSASVSVGLGLSLTAEELALQLEHGGLLAGSVVPVAEGVGASLQPMMPAIVASARQESRLRILISPLQKLPSTRLASHAAGKED